MASHSVCVVLSPGRGPGAEGLRVSKLYETASAIVADRGYMWDDSRGRSQGPKHVQDTHAHPRRDPQMNPMLLASGEGRNPRPER